MPSAAEVSLDGSAANVRRLASITAELIRILGFNTNFAPVLDVIDDQRAVFDNGLHSRAFGKSADEVVVLAGVYAETLSKGGVLGCVKHFPGIGAINIDSHDDLPSVGLSRDELFEKDLIPYKRLIPEKYIQAVMIGHAVFPEFDLQERDSNGKLLPTSLSGNIVTKLLREELNFKGLALTDDLEMGAIIKNYGIGEASKLAVAAGNDFLLVCNDARNIYEGFESVLRAVENGEISETRLDESLERIDTARKMLQPPLEFNIERIDELSSEIKELKSDIKH
jgi:beta-N-acetylhexosaminidase